MKTEQFINRHGIKMDVAWADDNPNINGMPPGSSHYKCTLKRRNKQMTVFFSMGPAHSKEPEVSDVLSCLASDAAGVENNQSFEEWCGEYGYDTDSRKAEKIYKTCAKQANKLKTFLGDGLYQTALWDMEEE